MTTLALIVSSDHNELKEISSNLSEIGFATNCVDSPKVADELVGKYAQDYDAVIVDVAALTKGHEGFIRTVRKKNPTAKIFATSNSDPSFWVDDASVVVCQSAEIRNHLKE